MLNKSAAIFVILLNMVLSFSSIHAQTLTYAQAGVDIANADSLVERIKPFCEQTRRAGWNSDLGSYGTVFDLKNAGKWREPLLISGTDGVGTKLLIAQQLNKHETIGIDLVAMSANDILSRGAEPLFFLDYYATGKLDVDVAADVIKGIAKGCTLAGCALMGGETAEMPQMYEGGKYDLAGITVGCVEKQNLLPKEVKANYVLIGLPSTGLHSNGFSLVRKIVTQSGMSLQDKPPFESAYATLGEHLLTPTKIYVKDIHDVLQADYIEAIAHITGSGISGNLPRVYNDSLVAEIDLASWQPSPLFTWLAKSGPVSQEEMLKTFNCGVGLILIVQEDNVADVLAKVPSSFQMGKMRVKTPEDKESVAYVGKLF